MPLAITNGYQRQEGGPVSTNNKDRVLPFLKPLAVALFATIPLVLPFGNKVHVAVIAQAMNGHASFQHNPRNTNKDKMFSRAAPRKVTQLFCES
jgi:hypothetical protein